MPKKKILTLRLEAEAIPVLEKKSRREKKTISEIIRDYIHIMLTRERLFHFLCEKEEGLRTDDELIYKELINFARFLNTLEKDSKKILLYCIILFLNK